MLPRLTIATFASDGRPPRAPRLGGRIRTVAEYFEPPNSKASGYGTTRLRVEPAARANVLVACNCLVDEAKATPPAELTSSSKPTTSTRTCAAALGSPIPTRTSYRQGRQHGSSPERRVRPPKPG